MAMRDKNKNQQNSEKTIEINAQMQGTLSFKDPVNLQINGNFQGTLETKGTLTVGSEASVEAHIDGENIVIAGKVNGDILAKKMLVLMPTAVLTGNISTPKLNVVEGAMFEGQCKMNGPGPIPSTPAPAQKATETTRSDLLDVEAVAKYLELDTRSVMELANSGKIPGIKRGDSWAFERATIDNWATSGRVK